MPHKSPLILGSEGVVDWSQTEESVRSGWEGAGDISMFCWACEHIDTAHACVARQKKAPEHGPHTVWSDRVGWHQSSNKDRSTRERERRWSSKYVGKDGRKHHGRSSGLFGTHDMEDTDDEEDEVCHLLGARMQALQAWRQNGGSLQ